MHNFTVSLVKAALDGSLLRQSAITNNIVNSNSINYQPMSVNFEKQLQRAQKVEDLAQIKPEIIKMQDSVKIDEQMVMSLKNATHYRALITGLNKYFSIMQLAIKG